MSIQNIIHVMSDRLASFVADCLTQAGATADDALVVADALVHADRCGVDSHGVARLRRYSDGVRRGKVDPAARPRVVRDDGACALIDAGNGLGPPAAARAMRLAIDRARTFHVGVVGLRGGNHFGIAGHYAEMAAAAGLVGFTACNATAQVVPTGGAEPLIGTNPIALALPVAGGPPFVLDMATSIVPRGRLEERLRRGEPIPAGWAVDAEGRDFTDVAALVRGLVRREGPGLLPLGGRGTEFGGHKGFGLGLAVELLCGPLVGALWGRHLYGPAGAGLGQVFAALDVAFFRPDGRFEDDAADLLGEVRGSRPVDPAQPVTTPGQRRAAHRARRSATGIPLGPAVVADLHALAVEAGLDPSAYFEPAALAGVIS